MSREEADDIYLNGCEAAKYLGLSPTTFIKYKRKYPFLATRNGKQEQVLLDDLKKKFFGEGKTNYYRKTYLDEFRRSFDQ